MIANVAVAAAAVVVAGTMILLVYCMISYTVVQVGPRLSMSIASVCFGGGMMLGGLGVEYHRSALRLSWSMRVGRSYDVLRVPKNVGWLTAFSAFDGSRTAVKKMKLLLLHGLKRP